MIELIPHMTIIYIRFKLLSFECGYFTHERDARKTFRDFFYPVRTHGIRRLKAPGQGGVEKIHNVAQPPFYDFVW